MSCLNTSGAMACENCGNPLEEGQRFCTRCGVAVRPSTEERANSDAGVRKRGSSESDECGFSGNDDAVVDDGNSVEADGDAVIVAGDDDAVVNRDVADDNVVEAETNDEDDAKAVTYTREHDVLESFMDEDAQPNYLPIVVVVIAILVAIALFMLPLLVR